MTKRPLLALHGISRDARGICETFTRSPKAAERVIIAPYFNTEDWPTYQRITRRIRSDIAILEILATLQSFGVIDGCAFDLFGFSGGAQLAHRFAMLYPLSIASLHICAAGWYCTPLANVPYPYGLDQTGNGNSTWPRRFAKGLSAFLSTPTTIYVGALDTGTQEASLRRNLILDAQQGIDRRTRAAAYCETLHTAAAASNLESSARLIELPGCGHSFDQCAFVGGLTELVLS